MQPEHNFLVPWTEFFLSHAKHFTMHIPDCKNISLELLREREKKIGVFEKKIAAWTHKKLNLVLIFQGCVKIRWFRLTIAAAAMELFSKNNRTNRK